MLQYARSQAPGVGHRGIEEELDRRDRERVQPAAEQPQRFLCLFDGAVAARQAGQVAHGAVGSAQKEAAGEGDFQGDDQVEAIYVQRSGGGLLWGEQAGGALLLLLRARCGAAQGQALARLQLVVAADEVEDRLQRVAARGEVADLGGGGAQPRQDGRGEQAGIFGMSAPVALGMRHRQNFLAENRPRRRPEAKTETETETRARAEESEPEPKAEPVPQPKPKPEAEGAARRGSCCGSAGLTTRRAPAQNRLHTMAVESAENRGPHAPPMTPTMPPKTGAVGVHVSPPVPRRSST